MSDKTFGLAVIGSLLLAACGQEAETPAPAAGPESAAPAAEAPPATEPPPAAEAGIPDRIVVDLTGFIPEGIEFDTNNRRFLTGSLALGSVFEIGNDGSATAVVEDPELISSVGIEVDEPRNRLLVTNSDRSVFGGEGQGQAKLGVYDLDSGDRIAMVDLGATTGGGDDAVFFANDVAVADDGTIYVTDTRMNVVYRVDNDYGPSVFYEFDPMPNLMLNGIVSDDDGYLIVVASAGDGLLYKIPLANPSAAARIELSEPATGADGLVWAADGTLAAVSNSTSSVLKLSSDDDWVSATVVGRAMFEGQATTGAAVDDDIYVVQPHFNDDDPPVILKVEF